MIPTWLQLVIEYCVTKWKDTYKAATRYLKWVEYDKNKDIQDIKKKADRAEDRLDEEINA